MKKKMNNKGFSLVELIVVIAIMAILAVTLAPRLTQYIDRSRKASDQEVVNTIYAAAKLAYAEAPISDQTITLPGTLGAFTVTDSGKTWTKGTPTASLGGDAAFSDAFMATLSSFKLKQNATSSSARITCVVTGGAISVTLYSDGTNASVSATE